MIRLIYKTEACKVQFYDIEPEHQTPLIHALEIAKGMMESGIYEFVHIVNR